MAIVVVGLNQKGAPVEVRERLALSPASIREALLRWRDPENKDCFPSEVVILSTCNRLEVYAVDPDPVSTTETICTFLENESSEPHGYFRPYFYTYTDKAAVRHLFSVASGLDSMILGEDQILGQVTEAMEICLDCGSSGRILSALYRRAIETGKRVRTETKIGHGASSVSHVAVELAQQIFGKLDHCKVLLVGADEMATIAARTLIAYGAGSISIINRTKKHANRLAEEFNASPLDWEVLESSLTWADIVITATGATQPLFYPDNVQKAMATRKDKPLFFIDIAVPRNVDGEIDRLKGVYRYDIDDFHSVVEESLSKRRCEIPKVEKIVEEQLAKFMTWFQSLDVVPTIVEMRQKAERIRQEEVDKVFGQLDSLSKDDRSVIEMMSERIISKLLHQPTIALKTKANQCNRFEYLDIVNELFGLNGMGSDK